VSASARPSLSTTVRSGGGNVGVDIIREAPADGHTLFMGSATFIVHPLLYKARYVPTRDFSTITQVTSQPYVLDRASRRRRKNRQGAGGLYQGQSE